MTSQTGQQIITYISQYLKKTGKLDQLIEYNMGNIFLEKSFKKYGEEASPGPIYNKSKLSISLDHYCEI